MRIPVFTLLLLFFTCAYTQVKLPQLFGDNMVLQRDTELKIWGWASPGERVNLDFKGKKYKTTADKDGKWTFKLPPQKYGGPYEMDFTAENHIKIKNILFGDVWICSGQSNMVIPMERVKEKYPEEIEAANYPEIRNFFVPTKTALFGPASDLPSGSSWKTANPKDILTFGAVSYFFAKNIYEKHRIPIGIINSSVGGTPIESWISEEGFNNFPEIIPVIQRNKDTAWVNKQNRHQIPAPKKSTDKGLAETPNWYETSYIPKGWRTINIPGYWEDQGLKDFDGVVWYRREIEVPESMTSMPAKIFMGRIVDADYVYINGKQVGNITYQYPPRRYEIPADLLKPGKNLIVVRVINNSAKGGFVPDKPYFLTANGQKIDLKGTWEYKVGDVFTYQPAFQGLIAQNQPTALYNAMLAPVINFSAKGFIWYQGESNSENPNNYDKFLMSLIADWRTKWNLPQAPFLFVQLPNYLDYSYLPSESKLAEMRNNQRKALSVQNTAMIVTTDCGEWNDIHPLNKKDIGFRLSLAAGKLAYYENTEYSGPLFQSSVTNADSIVITFSHVGSGLTTNDGEPLRYFSVASSDIKFVWANAEIRDNKVIVWSDEIKNPVFVRYNWADNPEGNLYNKEGLPASGFENE